MSIPFSPHSFRALAALLWALSPISAHAAHPLITEDTGTQGQGNFQFEFTNEYTTLREGGVNQPITLTAAALSYGVVNSVDIIITVPYLRLGQSVANGSPGEHGLADLGLDVKWRFYEREKLSFAFKPGITFPTGDDTRNLGAGKHTWSAYLTTSYETAPWTWHLHLGHVHHNNNSNERVDIWHASVAAERQLGKSLKVVLDAGIDTNTQNGSASDPVFAIAGLIWSIRPDFDLDLGFKAERTDQYRASALLAGLAWRW